MSADWLVVGLGNPGVEFHGTRHNVGADVVGLLATRHGGSLTHAKKERSMVDTVSIASQRAVLAFPQTYMNESGHAVKLLVKRYDVEDPARIVVVQDELDLPHARVRVKAGGGLAGHNGLRSIVNHLKTDEFLRVRIGIGKPPGGKEHGADHVLKRPSKALKTELEIAVQEAADAVEAILADGVQRAMNRFNSSPAL
ncbi:MAG TPA: aminoacyl-tRNA hydrolase [Acidimicrobiales bacterium]|nr:aminoacyl-tRNA hydrolase [Acidimicrobiales bacterium]